MAEPRRNYRQPFLRPQPTPFRDLAEGLAAIERAGIFTNNGPQNQLLEARLRDELFGAGAVATCNNATTGLLLAIRRLMRAGARYAVLPSFTFAAPAQAAVWNGLTPLFCDIDRDTWLPSSASETALLDRYGDEVAVVIPQATFGNCLDLERYEELSRTYGVPVVVDAASALGSRDDGGRQFGAGSPFPVVYSMHATKTFATAEGGLVHCRDEALVEDIRAMANFGFGKARVATMAGLNGKLTEVGALLALAKLGELDAVVERRATLVARYHAALAPAATFQSLRGARHAHQFVPVRLRGAGRAERDALVAALAADGIEVAHYFSPHLAEHEYFAGSAEAGGLEVTEAVAESILSLPMADAMTEGEVDEVAQAVVRCWSGLDCGRRLGGRLGRVGSGDDGRVARASHDALFQPNGVVAKVPDQVEAV